MSSVPCGPARPNSALAMIVSIGSAVSSIQSPIMVMASGATTDPSRRTMASTHWPTCGVLLEVAGIDQVHAPRPGDAAVDHDDLAVQAKIVSRDEGRQQTDGQGGLHADARRAEPLGLPAFPPGPGADGIDQHAAGDAPPAGADQGLEHLVGGPAFVPDVELHQHALAGVVDVARRSPAGSVPIPNGTGPCCRPRSECRPGRCPGGPCRGPPADAFPRRPASGPGRSRCWASRA